MPDLKRCWKSHQFKTREPSAFPGLWDCWIDLDTRKPLYSFTIIPTHATALDADYATIAALVMLVRGENLAMVSEIFGQVGRESRVLVSG